jgi:hypothetical protein
MLYATAYIECSLCRLIRRPEHLIGRHCCISRQTEGHSFGDHLIIESVSVTPSSVIEASIVLCSVSYDSSESMSNQPAPWTPDMYGYIHVHSTVYVHLYYINISGFFFHVWLPLQVQHIYSLVSYNRYSFPSNRSSARSINLSEKMLAYFLNMWLCSPPSPRFDDFT